MYLTNPCLTLAQGYVESGMNKYAVGSVGELGAFQVREEIWGRVPTTFIKQSRQYEDIMETLIKRADGDVWLAVKSYNGKGRNADRYVLRVQRRALQIAML